MINSIESMVKNEENDVNFLKIRKHHFVLGESNPKSSEEKTPFGKLMTEGKIIATRLNSKREIDEHLNQWLDNSFRDNEKTKTFFERLPGWGSVYSTFKNRLEKKGFLGNLTNFSLVETKRENIASVFGSENSIIKKATDERLLLVSAEYNSSESDVVVQLFSFSIGTMNSIYHDAKSNAANYMEIPPKFFQDIKERKGVKKF